MKLKLFQLIRYLIISYDFKPLKIDSSNNSYLLFHPYNEYCFIIVCLNTLDNHFYNDCLNKINKIRRKNFNNLEEGKILVLSFGDDVEGIKNNQFLYSKVLEDNTILGHNFLNSFRDFSDAFYKIDPKQEENEIEVIDKEIKQYLKPQINHFSLFDKLDLRLSLTMIMFILCFLIFILINISSGDKIVDAIVLGANYGTFTVILRQYWRLISASFVHIDFLHLLFNMSFLLGTGSFLERSIGTKKYLILVLFSSFLANSFSVIFNLNTVSMGFSGIGYAIMAIYIVKYHQMGILFSNKNVLQMLMINIVMNFLPNIDFYGHLGGFIAGVLFYYIFIDEGFNYKIKRYSKILVAIILLVTSLKIITKNSVGYSYYGTDIAVIERYSELGLKDSSLKQLNMLLEYMEKTGE